MFKRLGISLLSIHEASNIQRAVAEAEAFFVGGGNTFRLLKTLYEMDLIASIRARVLQGVPYIGSRQQ